jgi:hypothetical protein
LIWELSLDQIGMGAMADTAGNQSTGAWPQLSSGPLITGGVFIGVGAVVAFVGLAIAGSHVAAATRRWIDELETPPGQLARLKWEQAKSAAASGANTWRTHPHAQVRLARRSG